METQNILNLLNSFENEYSKLTTKNGTLLAKNQRVTIHMKIQSNFLTSSLESSLCDYSDANVLVTGNIAVVGANNNTKVAFEKYAPFRKFRTEINETFIDKAEHSIVKIAVH